MTVDRAGFDTFGSEHDFNCRSFGGHHLHGCVFEGALLVGFKGNQNENHHSGGSPMRVASRWA